MLPVIDAYHLVHVKLCPELLVGNIDSSQAAMARVQRPVVVALITATLCIAGRVAFAIDSYIVHLGVFFPLQLTKVQDTGHNNVIFRTMPV